MVRISPKVYFVVRIGTVQVHVLFQFLVFTIVIQPSQDLSHTLGSLLEPCMAARIYVLGLWHLKLIYVGFFVRLSRLNKCHFYEVKTYLLRDPGIGTVAWVAKRFNNHDWRYPLEPKLSPSAKTIPRTVFWSIPRIGKSLLDCLPVLPAAPTAIPTESTCVA